MQITETTNDGLKRAYTINIPAGEIDAAIDKEIRKVAPQIRMPGFRPGKVPANLVRKMHGEQLHAQILDEQIRGAVGKVVQDNALRPAMQPQIALGEDYEQGKDAEVTMSLEVLPQIEAPGVDGLTLERLEVPVDEAKVDEALERIAGQNKNYKDAPRTRKAKDGDQLIIDFVGSVDGEAFEGGAGQDTALVLGSSTFIPGFEEQLTGVKTGEEKTITVTFPEQYQAAHLAGKEAQFAVTVKQVKVEGETSIDDEFAGNLGLESLDRLKELLRAQLQQETAGLTRTQMKRQLLDKLAADHDFAVPQQMVDAEFEQIWAQLQQEAEREDDPAAAREEIEAERDDYRRIAERRVRLGLLLSEIGQANGVEITGQEMSMLIQQAAQQYREEDRERFIQYVQSEPMAAAQLRAPLYEDKVVDFLFDKAEVTSREVTREELEAAIEAEEGAAPAQAREPAKKKAAAKKKPATGDAAADAPAKKAPAGKASAKTSDGASAAGEKKAPAKKPTAKKAASAKADKPAKKEPVQKEAAKKEPARKASSKKAPAKK